MANHVLLQDWSGDIGNLRAGEVVDDATRDVASLMAAGAAFVPFEDGMEPFIQAFRSASRARTGLQLLPVLRAAGFLGGGGSGVWTPNPTVVGGGTNIAITQIATVPYTVVDGIVTTTCRFQLFGGPGGNASCIIGITNFPLWNGADFKSVIGFRVNDLVMTSLDNTVGAGSMNFQFEAMAQFTLGTIRFMCQYAAE